MRDANPAIDRAFGAVSKLTLYETCRAGGSELTGHPTCAPRVRFRLGRFVREFCAVPYEHVPHMRGNLDRHIPVDSGRPSGRPDNEAFCNEGRRLLTIWQNFEHPLLLRQKVGDDLALVGYQVFEFRLNSLFVAVVIEPLREMLTHTFSYVPKMHH